MDIWFKNEFKITPSKYGIVALYFDNERTISKSPWMVVDDVDDRRPVSPPCYFFWKNIKNQALHYIRS